jgi:hypothetical protein
VFRQDSRHLDASRIDDFRIDVLDEKGLDRLQYRRHVRIRLPELLQSAIHLRGE